MSKREQSSILAISRFTSKKLNQNNDNVAETPRAHAGASVATFSSELGALVLPIGVGRGNHPVTIGYFPHCLRCLLFSAVVVKQLKFLLNKKYFR